MLLNRARGEINLFNTEGHGTSFELASVIGFDFLFNRLFDTDLDGSVRAGIDIAGGRFRSDVYSSVAFDPQQQRSLPSLHRFTVDASSLSTYIEGRLLYPISSSIAVFAGPWTTYRLSATALQSEAIVSPQNAVFSSGGTQERVVAEGDALLASRVQYGMRLGLALGIPVSPALSVHQEFSISMNAGTPALPDIAHALRPAIGLTFQFGAPHRSPPEMQKLAPYQPVLSFSMFSLDSSGHRSDTAELRVRSVLTRRYVALPALLLFGQHPEIHHDFELLHNTDTALYSTAQLREADECGIYRHLLNIVGMRMRTDTNLSLVLAPVSGKGPHTHSDRAEAVRHYLTDMWSVDPVRIGIRPIHDTEFPKGAIVLQPSSPILLAPLLLQSQEEHMDAVPSIGISKTIYPDTGWTYWNMELQRNGHTLKTIDNSIAESGAHTLSFSLLELFSDTTRSPLTARFTVAAPGSATSLSDTLHIAVDRTSAGSHTIHEYTLFCPTAGLPTTVNDLLLDHLREFADENTAITISASGTPALGYAADIGRRFLDSLGTRGVTPAAFSITREESPCGPSFIRITAKKNTPGR